MGLLKRIFGSGDEQSDRSTEADIEKIKSGENHKLYPILKPGTWVGIKAGCVRQTLLGSPEEPELVIAYGYDAPSNFIFLTHDMMEGKDPKEIRRSAFENLSAYPTGLEAAMNGQILCGTAQDFSAEKILDTDFMLRAQEMLKAEELFVSIPRRKCMYIIADGASDEVFEAFMAVHVKTWHDDSYGNAQITSEIMKVKDGNIYASIPTEGMTDGD